jgi:hypothetical protein
MKNMCNILTPTFSLNDELEEPRKAMVITYIHLHINWRFPGGSEKNQKADVENFSFNSENAGNKFLQNVSIQN